MAVFKDSGIGRTDRSQGDRKRHRKLVEDAIKNNIGDIIAEESIISQSGQKKIKIPVKGIKEYQFAYGKNNRGTVSGNGREERGQVIGKVRKSAQPGQGADQAGDEPGEDIIETEITLEELVEYLFEDLALPDMERKKFAQSESLCKLKRAGHQRKGISARLDKKKSLIEKLKRKQTAMLAEKEDTGRQSVTDPAAHAGRIPFREDDLRYHRVREDVRPHSNAVVFCIMDTSGSMDQTRKYLARSFFFLQHRFLCWKYEHVEVVFIAHSTEAKEVNERDFFHRGAAGGTFISSGYAKTLEIIEQRYNPAIWNIYAFHCSDGDNWIADNPKAIALARELCEVCNLFGYCEIWPGTAWVRTMIWSYQRQISHANFAMVVVRQKADIWPAFKKMLDKESILPEGEDSWLITV